jgi:hypothetical protein
MMPSHHRHFVASLCLALFAFTATSAFAGTPRIDEAIAALQHAKSASVDPIGDVQKAQQSLRLAADDAGGYKKSALQTLDKILAQKPPAVEMNKMIDAALGDIEKAKNRQFNKYLSKRRR